MERERLPLLPSLLARWRSLPTFWRFQIAGWAVFVVGNTIFKTFAIANFKMAVISTLYQDPLAFMLTVGLYRYYKGLPQTMGTGSIAARVMVAVLIATVIDISWFNFVRNTLYDGYPLALPGFRGVVAVAINRMLVYSCWSLLYFWIRAALVGLAARSAANLAQLQALRAQMNPHFLFNALNSIVAEADDNPQAVKAMARELASYLRYSLAHRHSETVQLAAELEAMEHYLNVEKVRFEERLNFSFETTAEARSAQVPGFFLQPLVENAVKHGLQSSPGPMRILVRAGCTDGMVRIEVGNTGEWRTAERRADHQGFGLESIRTRLALLFPDRHRFDIERGEHWVNVLIEVPRT